MSPAGPSPLPARAPIETTRTSSPYFSPKSARAPSSCGVVRRHDPGLDRRVLPDVGVDLGLDRGELLAASSPCRWVKSKRSRSGATRLPRCATWSPSARRSASCSRWVAEWLARIALRRSWSTASSAAAPRHELALLDAAVVDEEPGLLAHVGDRDPRPVGAERAGVADLAAGLGVEGRLVQHDLHLDADRARSRPAGRRRRSASTCPSAVSVS